MTLDPFNWVHGQHARFRHAPPAGPAADENLLARDGALVSAEWLASSYCKAEINTAEMMGERTIIAKSGKFRARTGCRKIDPSVNHVT
jgi:hypothetical protein